jgi:hypothetical protein
MALAPLTSWTGTRSGRRLSRAEGTMVATGLEELLGKAVVFVPE